MSYWKRLLEWCQEPSKIKVRTFNPRNVMVLVTLSVILASSITFAWHSYILAQSIAHIVHAEYELLWTQPDVSAFDNFGTATYKDGILYAPSCRVHPFKGVFAINASNGDIIWNNKNVRCCGSSPCIDGDVIYVGETVYEWDNIKYFPRVMALNRTTGEEIWNFTEPNDCAWIGSPLVHGDYLYYSTYFYPYYPIRYGSGVYALNKTNGNPIWHQNIGAAVCSVAYHDGVVFVSAWDPPGQYALNATTGDIVWDVTHGRSWDSSPVIYDGMVIQALDEWSTVVLNETTGELIRRFRKGTLSTPLVHDGKIFIPTSRVMYAFDLMTGEELWQTVELHDGTYQDKSYSSPAGAGGAIFYQSLNGTFYVIDEADGSILGSYALGGLGFGSPSIGDGCVFINNDAGLYTFRMGPGSGDWPMFCQNNLHISYSEHGIEYVHTPIEEG